MSDKIELDTGTELPSSFVLTEEFKSIFNTIVIDDMGYELASIIIFVIIQ